MEKKKKERAEKPTPAEDTWLCLAARIMFKDEFARLADDRARFLRHHISIGSLHPAR
jgi:hypothetical protein